MKWGRMHRCARHDTPATQTPDVYITHRTVSYYSCAKPSTQRRASSRRRQLARRCETARASRSSRCAGYATATHLPPSIAVKVILLHHFYSLANFERNLVVVLRLELVQCIDILRHWECPRGGIGIITSGCMYVRVRVQDSKRQRECGGGKVEVAGRVRGEYPEVGSSGRAATVHSPLAAW